MKKRLAGRFYEHMSDEAETPKAEQAGHCSAYISSGNVGNEGGDLLARKTLERKYKQNVLIVERNEIT